MLIEDVTNWHIRVQRPLVQGRSQILQRPRFVRKLGEKKPCSPARKNMSDDDRCSPEPSRSLLSSGLSTKKQESAQVTSLHSDGVPRQPDQRDTRSGWKHVVLRAVAPVSQGCGVYANNGTHSRPALALSEVDVCVVGGFPFNLVPLARTQILMTIDQPPKLAVLQPASLLCIAAKVCFRTHPLAPHGRTVQQLAHETVGGISADGG